MVGSAVHQHRCMFCCKHRRSQVIIFSVETTFHDDCPAEQIIAGRAASCCDSSLHTGQNYYYSYLNKREQVTARQPCISMTPLRPAGEAKTEGRGPLRQGPCAPMPPRPALRQREPQAAEGAFSRVNDDGCSVPSVPSSSASLGDGGSEGMRGAASFEGSSRASVSRGLRGWLRLWRSGTTCCRA